MLRELVSAPIPDKTGWIVTVVMAGSIVKTEKRDDESYGKIGSAGQSKGDSCTTPIGQSMLSA